jgi:large subunit ribosomal protein L15
MALTLHTLKTSPGSTTRVQRVGRGLGRKGTTAGRGTKGQRARSGGTNKLKLKSLRQMLLRVPKLRGQGNGKLKRHEVTTGMLNALTQKIITPKVLVRAGLIVGMHPGVKLVLSGEVTRAMRLKGLIVSAGAKKAIEAAGGEVA